MAIEQGIWRIGDQPKKLKPAALADEALLEDQVMKDISILNSDWLLIGRQVRDEDDEAAEYLVPVRWLHTVPKESAFSEVGLFGNQNTVCKPTTPKWSHTINRLKQAWHIQ